MEKTSQVHFKQQQKPEIRIHLLKLRIRDLRSIRIIHLKDLLNLRNTYIYSLVRCMVPIYSYIQIGIIFIVSVSLHEFAHAYASYKLGDPTPKIQ